MYCFCSLGNVSRKITIYFDVLCIFFYNFIIQVLFAFLVILLKEIVFIYYFNKVCK